MKFASILLAAATFAGLAVAFHRSNAPSPEPIPPPPDTPRPQVDAVSRRPSGQGYHYKRGLKARSVDMLARDLENLRAREEDIFAELYARDAEAGDDFLYF